MTPPIVSLTAEQLETVMNVARSVPHALRHRYLELIADDLRSCNSNDRRVSEAATTALRRIVGVSYDKGAV